MVITHPTKSSLQMIYVSLMVQTRKTHKPIVSGVISKYRRLVNENGISIYLGYFHPHADAIIRPVIQILITR